MSSANDIFTAIRSMLIDSVDYSAYPTNTIKYGYQTPLQNNIITYWMINSRKTGITGVDDYDSNLGTRNNLLLFRNLIQVDFYSDDAFISTDNANNFHQYLTAFGADFLRENFTGMGMGVVDDIIDNTDPGDKATYLNRYTLRFSMFTHNFILRPQIFFDEIIVKPDLIA
jgi:hypothetical protein